MFHISHFVHAEGHSGSEEKHTQKLTKFLFWNKILCNDCITCQLNKPYPHQKQIAVKQDFKAQSLYFNH